MLHALKLLAKLASSKGRVGKDLRQRLGIPFLMCSLLYKLEQTLSVQFNDVTTIHWGLIMAILAKLT